MKITKYYYHRLLAEVVNPRAEYLRSFKNIISRKVFSLTQRTAKVEISDLNTYVVDFDSFPYSFNICELLLLAEVMVRKENKSGYRIVFNLESSERRTLSELNGIDYSHTEENNKRKFWNQIIGSLALSPSLKDFVILSDRSAYRRLDWNPSEPKM